MQLKSRGVLTALVAIFAMSAMTATAFASSKPTAETKPDTGVSETKVTLHGIVNPNGAATKYYFEYQALGTEAQRTVELSAGSGTTNLEESATLTTAGGLKANSRYSYRIIASNSNGTTDGALERFYTTATLQPEFKPFPTKKKFTSTSGKAFWRVNSGEAYYLNCSKSTTSGEVTGASTIGNAVIKFTGCDVEQSGKECPIHTTNTTKAGEVVTDPLKGELGSVSKAQAASEVGTLLKPEGHALFEFAQSEGQCTVGGGENWEGTISGEVGPIAKKQLTSTLVFVPTGSPGTPKIKEILVKDGPEKPELTGFYGLQMDLEQTNETTFEEALEVTL